MFIISGLCLGFGVPKEDGVEDTESKMWIKALVVLNLNQENLLVSDG
jgi:hypothetical protein